MGFQRLRGLRAHTKSDREVPWRAMGAPRENSGGRSRPPSQIGTSDARPNRAHRLSRPEQGWLSALNEWAPLLTLVVSVLLLVVAVLTLIWMVLFSAPSDSQPSPGSDPPARTSAAHQGCLSLGTRVSSAVTVTTRQTGNAPFLTDMQPLCRVPGSSSSRHGHRSRTLSDTADPAPAFWWPAHPRHDKHRRSGKVVHVLTQSTVPSGRRHRTQMLPCFAAHLDHTPRLR